MLVKFGLALIVMGLGYLLLVPAARTAMTGVKVSMLFLVGTFLLHTVAELLLSPVGLSTFSRLAPERFVSQMMGFWFVASSLGNLMAGLLAAGMDTETAAGLPDRLQPDVHDQRGLRRGAAPARPAADPLGARRQRAA